MARSEPKTQIHQLISGYKLPSELKEGERLQDLVLDSPDGKLYYQMAAVDLTYDADDVCDLWRTANHDLTVRIRRSDGKVRTLAYQSDE